MPDIGINMPLQIPGIPGMPLMPSFGFGGGTSGASTSAGVSNPFSIPFVFDNSGWNVMNRSKGEQTATGSTGAASGSPNAGSGIAGGLAGIPWHLVLLGAGAWVLLKNV